MNPHTKVQIGGIYQKKTHEKHRKVLQSSLLKIKKNKQIKRVGTTAGECSGTSTGGGGSRLIPTWTLRDEDEEEEDGEEGSSAARRMRMKCLSCKEEYVDRRAGTCRECYEEAGETEEELKREIDDLKSKVNFLRLLCTGPNFVTRPNTSCFSDVVLVASGPPDSANLQCNSPSIPAHRAVLSSRSPVFRAMLENEMEESLTGTIKISDVSYDALRAFVNYLTLAEACLDEHIGLWTCWYWLKNTK
ncbi:UNVERIFIED_CONTAM: BTB/POZ domain-containing protein [Sesamum angustifolium]|uniref:BTB/POZ domain-containing protein n=1 Tax=Sesamum angustifolium TaxID=2727405 RepID=A0AAW2L4S1_9LAMI